jgi:hypothetical protein
MQAEEGKRLNLLAKENSRIKRLRAAAEPAKAMLIELFEGNFLAQFGIAGMSWPDVPCCCLFPGS